MTGIARAVETLRATMRRGVATSISPHIANPLSPPTTIDLPNPATLRYNHSDLSVSAFGRVWPVHLWPAFRCPPRLHGGRQVPAEVPGQSASHGPCDWLLIPFWLYSPCRAA